MSTKGSVGSPARVARPRRVGWVLAALGVAIALEAQTFEVAFLTDPVGPKALPFVSALILILAGAHIAARSRSASAEGEERAATSSPIPVRNLLTAAAVFAVYAVALPVLGFFLCTTAAVAALSRLFGAPRAKAVGAAGALSAVLWLLFVQALALPLPIGSLWIR